MIATIRPSSLSGIVRAPASKSSMQRACAAAWLSKTETILHNTGHSNDDKAAIGIIKAMGASVIFENGDIKITPPGTRPTVDEVNCGESGLSIRMFTPLIAMTDSWITIKGEGSLLNRPMNFFDEILPQLGVEIKSNDGKLPIKVKGPLKPQSIKIDGSLSSQFLTGLLFAYSALGAENISIHVKDLKSRPYADLTIDVMKKFGMKIPENKNYREFYFGSDSNTGSKSTVEYYVESDWSGGAFLLVAGCIAGPITVRGLDLVSTQADKKIMEALSDANASVAVEAKGIKLRPAGMRAFSFDATNCPDLFPPLVTLAAFCSGTSSIQGVSRLAHKESDRAAALNEEFGKMGVKIRVEGDTMMIEGTKLIKGAKLHSHHDHRIAMACSVAALKAGGKTTIEAADSVNKSYPDFFDDLKSLHADVSLSSKIKFE